jgi:hypothetical protein
VEEGTSKNVVRVVFRRLLESADEICDAGTMSWSGFPFERLSVAPRQANVYDFMLNVREIRFFDPITYARTAGYEFTKPKFQVTLVQLCETHCVRKNSTFGRNPDAVPASDLSRIRKTPAGKHRFGDPLFKDSAR